MRNGQMMAMCSLATILFAGEMGRGTRLVARSSTSVISRPDLSTRLSISSTFQAKTLKLKATRVLSFIYCLQAKIYHTLTIHVTKTNFSNSPFGSYPFPPFSAARMIIRQPTGQEMCHLRCGKSQSTALCGC
eukprot:Lithocolla_globosa_v1_NODE_9255_length_728_cov_3.922734.p2 type:complete len:132 gc:universal NODE_9255_length_728_cov_3.922734:568-173(-)